VQERGAWGRDRIRSTLVDNDSQPQDIIGKAGPTRLCRQTTRNQLYLIHVHLCLQFTEEDGSAASIFDQSEGHKKLHCEVQFVDAEVGRVPSTLKNVFGQHQQEILAEEKMLREKRLKEMRLLTDQRLKHKRI
jgi:hypothetical protein